MHEKIFTGVRAKWLPLYEELKTMAEQQLGKFEERLTGSAVLWKYNTTFAEISAKQDCMVVGFASDTVHDEWEPVKTVQTSKNRVAHYFEVADSTGFPEMIARIAEAYALTQAGRTPKKAAETPEYSTIDEYIALFPDDIRVILEKIRSTIREAAPCAKEKISWKMPTFYQGENLIHFAVGKHHIGIYPGGNGVEAFADKLTDYKTSKGAIQFPLSNPIPYGLIAEITKFRAAEAEGRQAERSGIQKGNPVL